MQHAGIKLAGFVLAMLIAAPAFSQSLTIQGRVTNSSGQPLNGASTQFRIRILTPDANECVLYDESQVQDLSQSNGFFSLNLASGVSTVNAPSSYSLEQAISNRTGFSVNSSYCKTGSGTVSFSPSLTANRKIEIQFRDPGSMSTFETIPAMELNPVAYAMESRTLNGFTSGNLLRVENAGIPASAASFTTGQFNELLSLIGGTSNNYMSSSNGSTTGARLPTVAGDPSSPSTGSIWFDTTGSGAIKYRDSTGTIQTLGTGGGGGGGTITSITAGTGLTGGGSSGGVLLALSASGVTGAGVAVGSASAVPVITYDTYGRITSATTAAISSTLPSGTAGQFLKSSGGSTWAGAGILMGDLKNNIGSLPLFGTVNCSASQSMYWDSGTDQIRCQNISVGNSQISDVAWGKITGAPSFVANEGGTPSFLTGAESALPTVHVNGRIYIASDTKKIFRDNGTTWDELAPGSGGSLTNVLSGTGISVTGTGATRTVALDNTGKAAGTFYKVTTDADGRVSSGAGALVAADIPNLDWSKITTGKPDLVLNALNTNSFTTGPTSAQPTGQSAGRVFIDTTLQKIQYDNGTNWIDVASNGGSGFSGSLAGEVTGTQSATQVNNIAGITRSTITANLNSVSNATDAATASQLVKRDANGDFAGRKITISEVIVKGSSHTVSLTADPAAHYTLKLPDDKAASNGQVLTSDTNGVLSWTTPSSAGSIAVTAPVTNTSGTIGMPSANTSRDGYLTQADWNTFSGKLSSALNSARIWVGNGSNVATPVAPSGNVTVDNAGKFTVTGIRDQNISTAGTSVGQVLRYSAADTWTPQFLTMKDLRSTVTGAQALTSSCTAGKTMYWDSATDSLGCQDISISAATQINGVLPIANGGTGTNSTSQNFVFAGPSSGAGAPAFRALTPADISGLNTFWSSVTNGIGYSAGNVGIGTTNPTVKLDVTDGGAYPAILRSSSTDVAGLGINNSDSNRTWGLGVGGSGTGSVGLQGGKFGIWDVTAGAPRFTIDTTGRVGIGSSAPAYTLDVNGTARATQLCIGADCRSTWPSGGGGGVASVSSANADISVANGSTAPVLTLNSGTTAGSILKLDGSAKIPAVDGSQLTNLSAGQVSTGVLPIARGGTNSGTALNNNRLMASISGAIQELGAMVDGSIVVGKTGAAPQIATMSGDATISNTGALTLKNTGTAGTYGSASQVPVLTTDAQGRITGVINTAITASAASLSGTVPVANGGTGTINGSITGTGALSFAAGGTNQNVTISPSGTGNTILGGNVGVGTSSPQSTFETRGSANFYPVTNFTTAATARQLTIGEASNNSAYRMALGYYLDGGATWNSVIQSTANSSPANLLLNPTGGNVGVGTTAPNYKLDVAGSLNATSIYLNGAALGTASTHAVSVPSAANTLVKRDANGYIFNNYFNMTADVTTTNPQYLVGEWGSDNYLRYVAPSNVTVGNVTALSGTWDAVNYFRSNKGASSYVGGNSSYGLEAYSTDGGAAGMSFHRGGNYAVNLGLDPDNVLRIGGWSASANRWQLDMSGNNTIAGAMTATQFNGSGAGLTGTASSLNVNYATSAGSATTAGTANALSSTGDNVATSGWYRSNGNVGWYNNTYGGGIYMYDSTWIRTLGSKNFYVEGGDLAVSGKVGIGTTSPQTTLDVNGSISSKGPAGEANAGLTYAGSGGGTVIPSWTNVYTEGSGFNASSGVFQPNIPGRYLFTVNAYSNTHGNWVISVLKNAQGTNRGMAAQAASANGYFAAYSKVIYLNGSSDYVDARIVNYTGGTVAVQDINLTWTKLP